jgi:hypothetical protein
MRIPDIIACLLVMTASKHHDMLLYEAHTMTSRERLWVAISVVAYFFHS